MKIHIYSFIILFVSCQTAITQTGWYPLPSGTGMGLIDVHFTDNNTGYISGWYGTVKKTTNGGNNWTSKSVGNSALALRSIYFTDVNTGYIAAGDPTQNSGEIFKTTNGGDNWNVLNVPGKAHFYSVQFINSNTGFVSGFKKIFKTTNAGVSWISQNFPDSLEWFFALSFVDENTGYSSGGMNNLSREYIIKTTNGGSNWEIVYTDPGGYLFGINFQDASTGFSAGGAYAFSNIYIIRTTNGGLNWTYVFTGDQGTYLWSIKMVNSGTGYACGGSESPFGIILKTVNGGLNWGLQFTSSQLLTGSYFMNENTGFVVGGNGRLLKTTDGGGPFLGIKNINNKVPDEFYLYQNYPNPFNPITKIKFDIPLSAGLFHRNSRLVIYNSLGEQVKTLFNESAGSGLSPGTYEIEFDGSNIASGIYYYTLKVNDYKSTRKMILLK